MNRNSLLITGLLVLGMCGQVSAQQEFFPFLGEIKEDRVNVRAGQSENYERLSQLNSGTEVVVVDRTYSWYKILLPRSAKAYIIAKYVDQASPKTGQVNAKNVNIRAGAGVNHSIIGQLDQGDPIQILGVEDDWYEIAPPKEAYGWVSDTFIRFKSAKVPQAMMAQPVAVAAVSLKEPVRENIPAPEKSDEMIQLQGNVLRRINPKTQSQEFLLAPTSGPVFRLIGMEGILQDFINYSVRVEGKEQPSSDNQSFESAIELKSIEILL